MRARLLALIAVVAGIAAAIAAGLVLAGDSEESPPAAEAVASTASAEPAGPRTPALSGTNPITGKPVSLADFRGEPVVVNIWGSWCAPCNDEAPELARFAELHPEAVVLGIDLQDTVAAAKGFYRRYGWQHPSIFDPQGELAARLGLVEMPTTIFITADQRESSRVVGPVTFEQLEDGLAKAVSA